MQLDLQVIDTPKYYIYFKKLCSRFTWDQVSSYLNENIKKFAEHTNESLYAVFATIFSLLRDCYSQVNLHIEQMLGLDESVEEFLNRYLPQISSVPQMKIESFLDKVQKFIADGKIQKYERLEADTAKCIPQRALDEVPCILIDELCWSLNDAALRLVLDCIPRSPGRTTALRLLDEANVLSEARVNRSSYLNKLSVRTREGQTVAANLVALKADLFCETEEREPIELLPDHSYFFMGTEVDSAEPVYWDFDDAKNDNRHMLITGRSGVGKSYLLEKLLQQAAREKITTVILHSQGELPNIPGSNVINVEREKPGISFVTGEVRKDARKVANLLQKALRLRDTQKNTLQRVYEKYLNQVENPTLFGFMRVFKQVADEMKLSNTTSVRDRLVVFVEAQSFSGKEIDWSVYKGRTLILDFRDCTDDELLFHALTELFLQDLYAYKKMQPACPTIVVVDEFQVFNTRDGAALATVLREGRKYGWSLWLASQLAESGAGSSLKNLASQAFVQVYFSHGAKGNRRIANMIGITNQEQRQAFASLQKLGVGDFLIQQGSCVRRCKGSS